jgi:hypothetical protein
MNSTAALDMAVHYVHANPGTIAVATSSAAVVACPALVSVAVFNAAGLIIGGPVASDPPSSHFNFHIDCSKSGR